jgi:type IV pilus assembly protein PilB
LVDAGLLSQSQLEAALEEQRLQGGGGKRLGQLIVTLGFVTEGQLARVLSQQLAVPWVSLAHIDFSPSLLALVDRELAERYTVIPVYVRRERRDGDTLFLAMDDPTQDDVLRVVSERAKMPVRPMIAPPSDIKTAIARAYGPGTDFDDEPVSSVFPVPLVQKPPKRESQPAMSAPTPGLPPDSLPPPPPKPERASNPSRVTPPPPPPKRASQPAMPAPEPEVSISSEPEPSATPTPAAPATAQSTSATTATAKSTAQPDTNSTTETPAPVESKPTKSKTIALTLLDGTTIQIPTAANRARTRRRDEGAVAEKPAAPSAPSPSILAALKLATEGLSPEAKAQRWEAIVSALITVLVRKGTITEQELIDALK